MEHRQDNIGTGIEKQLSYYKKYLTARDALSSELAYSFIYNNVHPGKVREALQTVDLQTLPNRFFLIQVDDYQNYAHKLEVTQEFYQKTELIHCLRETLEAQKIAGFAANLVGEEQVICFICCKEQEKEEMSRYLLELTGTFQKMVRQKTPFTISVCISGYCEHLSYYSKIYPNMKAALEESYFAGKECGILLDTRKEKEDKDKEDVTAKVCYPELLAAVARRNWNQYDKGIQKMIALLSQSKVHPQKASLELVRILQKMEEYCLHCGVPKERLKPLEEGNRILSCRFIADAGAYLRECFDPIVQALEEFGDEIEYSFQYPVSVYVEEYFAEDLRLEDVAQVLGFSVGHFARTFRRYFNMTFVQYLTRFRLEKSRELLTETHIAIEQIAYRTGFNSYSYFCTSFKKSYGMSPGQYRQMRSRRDES